MAFEIKLFAGEGVALHYIVKGKEIEEVFVADEFKERTYFLLKTGIRFPSSSYYHKYNISHNATDTQKIIKIFEYYSFMLNMKKEMCQIKDACSHEWDIKSGMMTDLYTCKKCKIEERGPVKF